MYPESLLYWLGGVAVLLGVLGVLGMLAWAVDRWYQRHIERNHGAPRDDDQGRSSLWYVFEILSAVFVISGLLVAIYSDSALARAIAGIAMVAIVAAATASAMRDMR